MPTRKQRRQREKQRRHDYEEVWIDEEGREIEPPPEAGKTAPKTQRSQPAQGKAEKPARGGGGARGSSRSIRKVPPPSWERVLRRTAIFVPIMFVAVYYLQKSSSRSFGTALIQTAVLMAFFIPFSYLMDRMMYRTYLRRSGQAPPPRQGRAKKEK